MDNHELNDQWLIERLKSRDKEALSLLYDKYAPALYGVIFRIVKSHSRAEDILEKTFIKCMQDAHQECHTSLFTSIFMMARAIAMEELSSANAEAVSDEHVVELHPVTIGECSELMEGLDSQCGEVVRHLYINGDSLHQTALALNIPLERVKTQLRCALVHFNERIKRNTKVTLGVTSLISASIQRFGL